MDSVMPFAALDDVLPVAMIVAKATAVLLVALALATLMQRSSATARHVVWVASLCALLAIPVLSVWTPMHLPLLPATWGATRRAEPTVALPVHERIAENAAVTGMPASAIGATAQTAPEQGTLVAHVATATRGTITVTMVLTVIWAMVCAGILTRLVYGMLTVQRIVRRATALRGAEWQRPMMEIADRLGLTAVPRLVRADSVTMPFAYGLRAPVIVLPGDSETWSADRRTAVMLHELAHIRRRDIVGHTLGRVVCALYWFNPMAWMAARRLRAESERACDDIALGCGTRASDYAEHLLDIVAKVRHHGTPSVAMAMATRSEFEGRMLAILDPHLSRTVPSRVQASTLAGGVMMFAMVTGAVVPRAKAAPQSVTSVPERSAGARNTAALHMSLHAADDSAAFVPLPASPVAPVKPAAAASVMSAVSTQIALRNIAFVGRLPSGRTADDSSARASVLARILRTDSSSSLRRTAAWGLSELTDNTAARDALLFALQRDASAEVREMVAWALAYASDQSAVASALANALTQERDKSARETMVWALGDGADGKSPETIAALSAILGDGEAELRELAAWGIGNACPDHAPAALLSALGDRSARVRTTAAWALFQIEDADAVTALEAAVQREMNTEVRMTMVRALSVMGERAVVPLQRLIESSDASVRAVAIRALAGSRGEPWPQPRPRPRPFP
jgi:beta-lactamase regulating signal transducer with metallopeptidase domain/HEAT repeat protein